MEKFKVTKEQQELINRYKKRGVELGYVAYKPIGGWADEEAKPLNKMSSDQIAAAWLGVAEVEPEYVSFAEAMEALDEGETVHFHPTSNQGISMHRDGSITWLDRYSWGDLINGKFTVEDSK